MADHDNTAAGDWLKSFAAVGIALVFLAALLISIAVMWDKADDANNEAAWARWTFLLSGVEAVAFAGAGWLFGREVHRGQAEAAELRTDRAMETAQSQMERAARAEKAMEVMGAAITAKRDAHAAEGEADARRVGGPAQEASALAELNELIALAERLRAGG